MTYEEFVHVGPLVSGELNNFTEFRIFGDGAVALKILLKCFTDPFNV